MRCQPKTIRVLRAAFTLVELLVVIALILVIAAIGILTIPLMQSQQKATQNASLIVSSLGNVKSLAFRTKRPTGIRFVPDPNSPNFVRELYFVQTPDDYTGGTLVLPDPNDPKAKWNVVTFLNVDFYAGLTAADLLDWAVQPGDYLEFDGGGLLYQINAVSNNSLILSRPVPVTRPTASGNRTDKYRIIRQPRRMTGEDSFTLSGDVAIDLSQCLNLPVRSVVNSPVKYYEILFAPNGGVVGKGTVASDKIILWVRDSTKADVLDNDPVLISVQVRTGFIGSYQADRNSNDPYSYVRDPRASGM